MISASKWHRGAMLLTNFLCIVALCGLWGLISLPKEASLKRAMQVETAREIIRSSDQELFVYTKKSSNITTVGQFQFSNRDLALYREIYALQQQGEWEQANATASYLKDPVLVADVLAERFLHPDYNSSYGELNRWLQKYTDHPKAARIHRLASRKKPASARLQTIKTFKSLPVRYGIRDGIGGKNMPRGWSHALNQWENGDFAAAAKSFSEISRRDSLSSWQASGAHYWAYRSHARLNQSEQAASHLREAARHPFTLYGALAASQFTPRLYQAPYPVIGPALSQQKAIRRAAALVALGNSNKATAELRHLYPQLDASQRGELLSAAVSFGLPELQLQLSQHAARQYDSTIAAYPVPQWIPTYKMMVEPALVYAIIRQESNFNPNARSYAGAQGAMQIMPDTARYMIDRYRLNEVQLASLSWPSLPQPISEDRLFEPDVNLVIGQHYIRYLGEKPYIEQNVIYLLAAYNAGPANLLKWQERFAGTHDPLLFMERIPFKETRHYVKQVMSNYLIYQTMLSGQAQAMDSLQRGEWPRIGHNPQYAAAH